IPGGWRTFFHVNPDHFTGAPMRIRSAFTAGGETWEVEEGDRVVPPASGAGSLGVADPAPAQLPEGGWVMALKSFITPTRPGQGPPGLPVGLDAHSVGSATSADGPEWVREPGIRLAAASVPAAFNDGGQRVLLYYVQPPLEQSKPETVACAVSADGTYFRYETEFRIEGLSTLKAVDPSIVRDEDGRFRLYYLASDYRGDPARGPSPDAIHLALCEDGVHFREFGPVFEYPDLVDPDVFRFRDQWWMFVFTGGRTIVARSPDGFRFEYARTLPLPGWGTTAPVVLPDGRLRLYAFDQRRPAGNAVRSFVSEDGLEWVPEPGDRIQARPDEQITDPFVIPWRGGYKMYFKTSPAQPPWVPAAAPGRETIPFPR
ncbi:MAG: hypothetical protein ACPL88_11975, partial [Bryobacteraceae bacterium]